ncbi:MAG: hypothetical protein HC850_08710 [Rhodomicrobium sp.]|nr:hypothetical protein [Rhodomicrobium sp.]
MKKLRLRHTALSALLCVVTSASYTSPAHAQQTSPALSFGIGWSSLHMNDIEFAAITDFLVTEVQDHQSNHDGEFDGYKLTGELTGLAPRQRGEWLMTTSLKGFYSRYEDEQQTRCVYTADTDCVFFPLIDPDPDGTIGLAGGADASGGFFADWLTDVERKVVYWGAAVELDWSRLTQQQGSFKDAPVTVAAPFQWRTGLALRRIDQDSSLFSVDRGPTADPVTLNDDLDTTYYGGYVGFSTLHPVSDAMRLRLAAETGLYYAQTDYRGSYSATASLGDDSAIEQSLSLDDSAPASLDRSA